MKILKVTSLAIPDVKVIRFARFRDHRGYFTEQFRKSDIVDSPQIESMRSIEFVQANESYSLATTIRGLHFQWDPRMGKLVRTLAGRMVDLVLDIRKDSPTFGRIIAYDMPADRQAGYSEWIWVPPGFAHGNFFTEESLIEYMCSASYNSKCESGISPLSKDIDWSLCDPKLKAEFDRIAGGGPLMTEKDTNGHTLDSWQKTLDFDEFVYGA
ncbi:MAG: dTDP-4-dehydrorhamnose 3,5-epimerase family protein [Candidatus Omnitrophota bacterium]